MVKWQCLGMVELVIIIKAEKGINLKVVSYMSNSINQTIKDQAMERINTIIILYNGNKISEFNAFSRINKLVDSANKIEDLKQRKKHLKDDIETLDKELEYKKSEQEKIKKC